MKDINFKGFLQSQGYEEVNQLTFEKWEGKFLITIIIYPIEYSIYKYIICHEDGTKRSRSFNDFENMFTSLKREDLSN